MGKTSLAALLAPVGVPARLPKPHTLPRSNLCPAGDRPVCGTLSRLRYNLKLIPQPARSPAAQPTSQPPPPPPMSAAAAAAHACWEWVTPGTALLSAAVYLALAHIATAGLLRSSSRDLASCWAEARSMAVIVINACCIPGAGLCLAGSALWSEELQVGCNFLAGATCPSRQCIGLQGRAAWG